HDGADLGGGHPEEEELRTVAEVEVERVAAAEPVAEEQMGGAVHRAIELAPGPARGVTAGVLEEEERRVGESSRLVFEGALQSASADDQHAMLLPSSCARRSRRYGRAPPRPHRASPRRPGLRRRSGRRGSPPRWPWWPPVLLSDGARPRRRGRPPTP